MENYTFYNPTKIYFGEGQIKNLKKELKPYGKNVLLVYGGGSIKKNGVYDAVLKQLKGFNVSELKGVKPNPRLKSVEDGKKLCLKQNIDMVLAVGGGSSIDCAKAICASVKSKEKPWDLIMNPSKIKDALPLFTVLTMAATGSEMDHTGVITNPRLKIKKGFAATCLYPKASILDPTYTYSVPVKQSASGVADIMSHIMESYFSKVNDTYVTSQICLALLKVCVKYGKEIIDNPTNYEARANIMWASSLGISELTYVGTLGKKWSCHPMQHVLGAHYDCTHGEALSIITPAWMTYVLNDETVEKFSDYGIRVFDLNPFEDHYKIAQAAIEKTYDFFTSLGLARNLEDIGVKEEDLEMLAGEAVKAKGGEIDGFITLTKEDVLEIYQMCFH